MRILIFRQNLHGPLLPKNPAIADYLILKALQKKYGDEYNTLSPLDDKVEIAAKEYIVNRFSK